MLHSAKQGGVCTVKDARFSRPSSFRPRATRVRCAAVLAWCCGSAWAANLVEIQQLVDGGRFQSAESEIAKALAQPSLSPTKRQALSYERERMRRILLDFTLTADAAQARVQRQIADLKPAEFAA